jgi:hypothetical protein
MGNNHTQTKFDFLPATWSFQMLTNPAVFDHAAGSVFSRQHILGKAQRTLCMFAIGTCLAMAMAMAMASGAGAQTRTANDTDQATAQNDRQQDNAVMLAKAELSSKGITSENTSKVDYQRALDGATNSVLSQRSSGMGWGAIANKMGLNWGKVMSESKHESKESVNASREKNSGGKSAESRSSQAKSGDNGGGGGKKK